jgi:tetratricopeptide (TPR) repeat protein
MGLLDQAAAARILGIDPHLSAMLCATHANFDSNLEHALDVCDRVILHTGRVFIHAVHVQEEFYRSTILYRLGRYQEALEGLDDAVDADPKDVSALLYRACVKGKLGDTAGKQADIATARAIDAHQADDLLKNLIGDGA